MVPYQSRNHPLLARLFSARILHPLNVEWSHPHIPGERYSLITMEEVLARPCREGVSASSGLPILWGYTLERVYIIVVYQRIDEDTIRVVTAYPVPEP